MPTTSVIAAIKTKFDALSAAGFPGNARPALFFDQAPVVNPAGGQIHADTTGYVVLRHSGTRARLYAFGGYTREDMNVEFEVYYASLGDANTAKEAIKAGFDYSSLADLDSGVWQQLAIRPVSDRPAFGGMGRSGGNVHQWTVGYRIELVRNPAT